MVLQSFVLKIVPIFALFSLGADAYGQEQPAQGTATAVLEVQVGKPIAKVSPMLYGLMTEEINHSYDGGIYAELVRNRTFQDDSNKPVFWTVVQSSGARASIALDKSTGPSEALPVSLKLDVQKADDTHLAGVENEGYWGFGVCPNTTYRGSFYAKAGSQATGPVTVTLVNDYSGETTASATVPDVSGDWKQYTFELKTSDVQSSSANHLKLEFARPGTVWLSLVSLFPPTYDDRPNGNRIDLMEKLAAMRPAFLRLPGGNYLEGDHIDERFEWKKTLGPLVDRPGHEGPWGYRSSDGMGLLEFLEWCEDLHMDPVLAVYAGYSLRGEHIDPGPKLQPFVNSALEEIEYVTGGPDAKWGAVRARNGHPKPFPLTYVEVGNEDWFDKSGSYDGRFAQFYDAIKKKYPNLQLIATTPVKGRTPDVIDDHFYKRAEQFFDDIHHYDKTSRSGPKIFVGEWATMEGSPTPNFNAALGDAAWMTGMERNSDVVIMSSYAPLLANVNPGGWQWRTNLIGYDALNSFGSPSYYAQVMFGTHVGDQVVASKLQGAGPLVFYSVTRDSAKGKLDLKVVNASPTPQAVDISLQGTSNVGNSATLISLRAQSPRETNSITEPTKIVPVESSVPVTGTHLKQTFAPYSINVVELPVK
jgi:alpha-L-arabinofuranosidase